MLRKFITLVFLLFLVPINCLAVTHKEYFDNYLEPTSVMLETLYFKGPISYELAKIALARQVLEDGISRKPNNSVAGISVGGFNSEIANDVLKETEIKIGRATDSEGGTFYSFQGEFANIYSALIIARLFDFYPEKFLKKDKKHWFMAKETSKAICQNPDSFELNHRFHNQLKPCDIIKKANSLYGPQAQAVLDISKNNIKPLEK